MELEELQLPITTNDAEPASASPSKGSQRQKRRRNLTPRFSVKQLALIICIILVVLKQFDVQLTAYIGTSLNLDDDSNSSVIIPSSNIGGNGEGNGGNGIGDKNARFDEQNGDEEGGEEEGHQNKNTKDENSAPATSVTTTQDESDSSKLEGNTNENEDKKGDGEGNEDNQTQNSTEEQKETDGNINNNPDKAKDATSTAKQTDGNNNDSLQKDQDTTSTASTDEAPVVDDKDNTKVDEQKAKAESDNKVQDTKSTTAEDTNDKDDKDTTSSTADTSSSEQEANTESDNKVQDIKSITSTTAEDTNDKDDKDTTSNTTDTSSSSSLSSCTFQNSQEWLNGPRISNIDEEEMTDELIQDLILHVSPMDEENHGSKSILQQSICLEESGFLNWDKEPLIRGKDPDPKDDDLTLQQNVFRLMFLALHEHQYGPAREEALARYGKKEGCEQGTSSSELTKSLSESGVGRMDYECPNTKYIVSIAANLGFGASLRTGMMDPVFFGLTTNRVTLFLNSLKFMKPRFKGDWETELFISDWLLGSCPRDDLQCVYMPFSPCTLTEQDMLNAKILSKDDRKYIRSTGKLPEEYENDKVVILLPDLNGHKPEPAGLRSAFVNIIKSFYANRGDKIKEAWQLDDSKLQKVYDYILDPKTVAAEWISRNAVTNYVLRPNLQARKILDKEMERILPKDFDPNTAVGFPIRGSDKCFKESECYTYDKYMEIVKDWIITRTKTLRSQNDTTVIDKIILTSEDKKIVQARKDYEPKNETFPYEFVVNDADIGQGTGLPRQFKKGTGDEIMLASLVSMKMQLHSESLLLNHCSNFHKLIMDLAGYNCGVVKYLEVLKHHDNPDYRIKCQWGR